MSVEITVPAAGESITEVTVARWLKADGDLVHSDEPVCEIDTDKASMEIPAPGSGRLKILVPEGETVKVGEKIAEIEPAAVPSTDGSRAEAEATNVTTGSAEQPPSAEGKAKVVPVKVPAVGESITEVTISQWLKKDGEPVKPDEIICEIDTDKTSFELPAEVGGILHIKQPEGATVPVGEVVAEIVAGQPPEAAGEEPAPAVEEKPAAAAAEQKPRLTPVAARILQEAGIDPATVTGSGAGGRITKEDALRAVEAARSTPGAEPEVEVAPQQPKPEVKEAAPQATVQPEAGGQRTTRREKMSTLRKTIANRLVMAKNQTAMLTTFNEVDMSQVIALRKKYRDLFREKYDVNLGFMSFFTRAVCLAIRDWPVINAQIDGDEIVYFDYVDVSIAVSTPKGLVAPVIRNADRLSLAEIEAEVARLAARAREGKLSIDELTGGTFTITNGGVFGSLMSTPILNPPQSAILGMHRIQERPVVVEGQVVVRPMMYVALSYDHRLIDGRESVSFLVRVKELLEDPSRMLLEI